MRVLELVAKNARWRTLAYLLWTSGAGWVLSAQAADTPASAPSAASTTLPQSGNAGDSAVGSSTSSAQASDGFHVTPEIMTATNSGSSSAASSDSTTSTLGLEYQAQKSLSYGDSELDRITKGDLSGSALQATLQAKASGKVPANREVNVGDTVDLALSGGGNYELNGDQHPFAGYATLQANGGFEYAEQASTRHFTYGVDSEFHFYDTPSAPPWMLWLNVLDWPGQLLRPLTMQNAGQVRDQDRSWPTVALGFDRVDPQKDDARKAVDPSLASYNRLHEGVSAASQLGKLWNGRDIVLGFKYDHWQELDATEAIEKAHLANQSYREFYLVARGTSKDVDWLITYSSGAAPADQTASKIWKLGWQFNFGGAPQK